MPLNSVFAAPDRVTFTQKGALTVLPPVVVTNAGVAVRSPGLIRFWKVPPLVAVIAAAALGAPRVDELIGVVVDVGARGGDRLEEGRGGLGGVGAPGHSHRGVVPGRLLALEPLEPGRLG